MGGGGWQMPRSVLILATTDCDTLISFRWQLVTTIVLTFTQLTHKMYCSRQRKPQGFRFSEWVDGLADITTDDKALAPPSEDITSDVPRCRVTDDDKCGDIYRNLEPLMPFSQLKENWNAMVERNMFQRILFYFSVCVAHFSFDDHYSKHFYSQIFSFLGAVACCSCQRMQWYLLLTIICKKLYKLPNCVHSCAVRYLLPKWRVLQIVSECPAMGVHPLLPVLPFHNADWTFVCLLVIGQNLMKLLEIWCENQDGTYRLACMQCCHAFIVFFSIFYFRLCKAFSFFLIKHVDSLRTSCVRYRRWYHSCILH